MEYSDKVMDHFANPRNTGRIENPKTQADKVPLEIRLVGI